MKVGACSKQSSSRWHRSHVAWGSYAFGGVPNLTSPRRRTLQLIQADVVLLLEV